MNFLNEVLLPRGKLFCIILRIRESTPKHLYKSFHKNVHYYGPFYRVHADSREFGVLRNSALLDFDILQVMDRHP